MNFFILVEEKGSSDGQARHSEEGHQTVLERRSRSIHWRPNAQTFVLRKAWQWKNRSSLNFLSI